MKGSERVATTGSYRKGRRSGRAARRHDAPRVLVIYKKSHYQIYVHERRNARVQALVAARDPAVSHLLAAHEDHVSTLADARQTLSDLGAKAVFRYRSDTRQAEDVDLVVTLGGDGTFLWASHFVGSRCPMVAINTAPDHSVGYFCAGTRHELRDVLQAALTDRLPTTRLTRMRVDVDGERVANRVLNDALFCHQCAAATSRYMIGIGETLEDHKSSGIWVGPAAGSTAAQRSAGGRKLPIASKRLQYVVREPYAHERDEYRYVKGLIRPGEQLRIVSKIREGRLYLDGPHLARVVDIGSELCMQRSDEPLKVLGFSRR